MMDSTIYISTSEVRKMIWLPSNAPQSLCLYLSLLTSVVVEIYPQNLTLEEDTRTDCRSYYKNHASRLHLGDQDVVEIQIYPPD
jgi:hypothetical protein